MFAPAIAGGPPPRLSDLEPVSLFVDFDGTLVDLVDNPGEIRVDAALRHLLVELSARSPGRVALVSGRSISQLDGFLGPLGALLTLVGSHGAELRRLGGKLIAPERPSSLEAVERDLAGFATANPGLHVELKSHGTRSALPRRAAIRGGGGLRIFAGDLARATGLVLQTGKMMVELRGPGDKGDAVRMLMRDPPMAGARPLFVGDDLTDEDGFSAARRWAGPASWSAAPRATGGPAIAWRTSGRCARWLCDGDPMTATLDLWPIGNCQVSALIDRAGRFVWGCVPRVDGDPAFCSLLDDNAPRAGVGARGFWEIDLEDRAVRRRPSKQYLRNTPVLVTRYIRDAMPATPSR